MLSQKSTKIERKCIHTEVQWLTGLTLKIQDNKQTQKIKITLTPGEVGKWSLDRISLDQITWSKFSNKIGVWSKLCLFTWSKVLINHINISSLDRIFWDFSVDRNFKITQNDINQLPKNNLQILALDWKF